MEEIARDIAGFVMVVGFALIAGFSVSGVIHQIIKERKGRREMFRAFIVCPVCGDSQELQNVPRHFRFKCPDCEAEMEGTVE